MAQVASPAQHTLTMLTDPAGDASSGDEDLRYNRLTAVYTNQDEQFLVNQRTYQRQYAQLYFTRLTIMRGPLAAAASARWPGTTMINILKAGEHPEGQPCFVIGTIAKEMKLRPSILSEYTKDRGLQQTLGHTKFIDPSDRVALEDDGGRMALTGPAACLPIQELVTGMVVAVRGMNTEDGVFMVEEVMHPGVAPQVPRPVLQVDKYVALVSGLALSSNSQDMLPLQKALDYVSGTLGCAADQLLASKIVRLVIAGGSVGTLEVLANATAHSRTQHVALQPVKDLDLYVAELAGSVAVDVMPGAEDPTNVALPQQPLHRCLMPVASKQTALVRATNPHAFSVDGVQFLGHSGQPVEDVLKYSSHTDRMSVLRKCLAWRHLAPTAPDTLATYPFADTDPFILQQAPHVLFMGCQPGFACDTETGPAGQRVTLVAVPSFAKTGVLVLLNLRTMECRPMDFSQ